MKEHIKYLDGWRGLAIGAVLLSHFGPHIGADIGRMGVDLFFVLSGLLMSRMLYEQRVPLRTFYRRRISRVFPVFFLFIVVMVAVSVIFGLRFLPEEIVGTLTFTRTYFPADIPIWQSAVPVGHMWSLNVEEHSYVFLALLASIAALKRREGLILIGAAGLTILTYLWYRHIHLAGDFELRTECAATGLLLSAGYRQYRRQFEGYVRAWMPTAALLIGAMCYLNAVPELARVILVPALFAFSINHVDRSAAMAKFLETRALCMLGLWSYSIYIWQQPFFKFKGLTGAPVALFLAVLCGLASFYLYEAPIRDWLNGRRPVPSGLPERA